MQDDPALDAETARQLRLELVARLCTCPFPNTHNLNPHAHWDWCAYKRDELSATPAAQPPAETPTPPTA